MEKFVALDGANRPIDGGTKRTRAGWASWASRNGMPSPIEKKVGFQVVVGQFYRPEIGHYFRINLGAQPLNPRTRLNSHLCK